MYSREIIQKLYSESKLDWVTLLAQCKSFKNTVVAHIPWIALKLSFWQKIKITAENVFYFVKNQCIGTCPNLFIVMFPI
jgi:hypothetical protein